MRRADNTAVTGASVTKQSWPAWRPPSANRRECMNRPQQSFPPILDRRGPPRVRRFDEQRWLIDNIIRANGIDWDQPRSLYIHLPCGIEANADFAGIRERVKKMADIGKIGIGLDAARQNRHNRHWPRCRFCRHSRANAGKI